MHPALIILIATLSATLLSLSLAAIALVLLRMCGIRAFFTVKRRPKRHAKAGEAQSTERTATEWEIPEEELLVLLSAAVMATLDDSDPTRFRVVAFRRI